MTHSLHRRGTAESLKNDYVLLVTAASGINHEGSKDKLRQVLEVVYDVGPCNIGDLSTGTLLAGISMDEIKASLNEVPRVRCCFSTKEKMFEVIKRIHALDLGMSVTVEGPINEVIGMGRDLGVKPHSINLSLDIWGRTEELPSEEVLEFVTMCGHGLISASLVEKAIGLVKNAKMTPRQAAVMISHPCVCGIYNPDRATELFQKYVPAPAR